MYDLEKRWGEFKKNPAFLAIQSDCSVPEIVIKTVWYAGANAAQDMYTDLLNVMRQQKEGWRIEASNMDKQVETKKGQR